MAEKAIQRKPRVGKTLGRRAAPLPDVKDMISAEADQEIKDLMQSTAEQNELMNQHKKAYERDRAKLLAAIKKAGKKEYTHANAKVNGRECRLDAVIETPVRREIDVAKLKGLVKAEVFLRCISASVGSVEAEAGVNIVNECAVPKDGTENVSVKASARS